MPSNTIPTSTSEIEELRRSIAFGENQYHLAVLSQRGEDIVNKIGETDIVKLFLENEEKYLAVSMEFSDLNEKLNRFAQKVIREAEVVKVKQQRKLEFVNWLTIFFVCCGLGAWSYRETQ